MRFVWHTALNPQLMFTSGVVNQAQSVLPLEGLPFKKWYVHGYASSAHEVHY